MTSPVRAVFRHLEVFSVRVGLRAVGKRVLALVRVSHSFLSETKRVDTALLNPSMNESIYIVVIISRRKKKEIKVQSIKSLIDDVEAIRATFEAVQ